MHSRALIADSPIPQSRLWIALALSFLLHLLLLTLLQGLPERQERKPIQIRFVKAPPAARTEAPQAQKQYVSPSEAPEEAPRVPTNLRSDRDTRADKEQLKRGEPDAGVVSQAQSQSEVRPAEAPPAEAPPAKAPPAEVPPAKVPPAPPKEVPPREPARSTAKAAQQPVRTGRKASLRLSEGALAREFGDVPVPRANSAETSLSKLLQPEGSSESTLSDDQRLAKLSSYTPYRANRRSLFSGTSGVPDYLPHIQDGEITLLNAKADRHAVFVRRVALQVFGALRRSSWSSLPFRQASAITGFTTVHAVMSPQGKLLRVELRETSGSPDFDSILQGAAKSGTWDQNPPADAKAEDGNIHFVFKSRTWARQIGEGVREQRWLLLSTGLL